MIRVLRDHQAHCAQVLDGMPDSPEQVRQNETSSSAFPWDAASTDAASLLADDRLTDVAIANRVGVSRATLGRWKQHPEFKAKVSELTDELFDRARRRGLARIDRRMERYEKRAKALDMIVADRAKDMKGEAPGGRSGYLVRTPKRVQVTITTVMIDDESGKEIEEVETHTEERYEYAFDAALSREMRELEKQVAQDTGQWSEKREITGPDGSALRIEVVYADPDPDAS